MPPDHAPGTTTDRPRVTIVMATFNGAAHLREQLDSFCAQRGVDWDLWVSDDGSTDDTRALLSAFQQVQGGGRTVRLVDGPGQGSAANFMTLLAHPDLPTDRPVALSDQDDVWHPDKLARAVAALETSGPMTLYSGQSLHTDAMLRVIGHSRPPQRAPGFCNALVQNVVSGHSIVMDPAALALVRKAGVPDGIPYHDWWLYQLISGAGGHIRVDRARMVHYRQHSTNTMGAHHGLSASVRRLGQVFGKTYGGWIRANTAALSRVAPLLTPQHQSCLRAFCAAPRGPRRALALRQLGLYRQSRATTAVLVLATALGRI